MGLAAANTTDGETLLNVLYNVTYDGASGSIKFNEYGEVIGRYDYVQLDGETYTTFGKWQGTITLNDGEITLPDGSTWTISDNKATMNKNIQSEKATPGLGVLESLISLSLVILVTVAIRRKGKS